MEKSSRNIGEVCPQLLDLIPKDEWLTRDGEIRSHGSSEEKKLELRLGPPGGDWITRGDKKNRESNDSVFSLGYFSNKMGSANGIFMDTIEMNIDGNQTQNFPSSQNPSAAALLSSPWSHQMKAPFLQFPTKIQTLPVMAKEASQPCCTKLAELKAAEKKSFLPPSANTAVPNSSQKRTAPAPVVGWPPIRSFRKNHASNGSSKPGLESQNMAPNKVAKEKPEESCKKGLFVKINMDGVPIGRKVDLKAYDSYEKLSSAVDELFRGLLAAQKDSSLGANKQDEKAITGLLDGAGEYTLVYEDNEGDRMLVGDVPWHMFVSTAKRLRVLKSSEISALSLGSNKQERIRSADMK